MWPTVRSPRYGAFEPWLWTTLLARSLPLGGEPCDVLLSFCSLVTMPLGYHAIRTTLLGSRATCGVMLSSLNTDDVLLYTLDLYNLI